MKALWALPVKNGGVASLCLEYNRGRRCGLCMSVLIKGGVASLSVSVKEGVCVWGGVSEGGVEKLCPGHFIDPVE